MRKVSAEEIDKLYRFTRQHYVEYYDVQTELVDHLANAIEEEWKEDPEQEFAEVLQREFRKFGVFGFSDVVEQRQRAMGKKYYKLIWEETKSVLRKPQMIFLVVFQFWSLYFLLGLESGFIILMGVVFLTAAVALCYLGNQSYKYKKRRKEGEKIYLLEAIILNAGGAFPILWMPFQLFHFSEAPEYLFGKLLICFVVIVLIILGYIAFYVLPKKKDEILKKAHPELKFIE